MRRKIFLIFLISFTLPFINTLSYSNESEGYGLTGANPISKVEATEPESKSEMYLRNALLPIIYNSKLARFKRATAITPSSNHGIASVSQNRKRPGTFTAPAFKRNSNGVGRPRLSSLPSSKSSQLGGKITSLTGSNGIGVRRSTSSSWTPLNSGIQNGIQNKKGIIAVNGNAYVGKRLQSSPTSLSLQPSSVKGLGLTGGQKGLSPVSSSPSIGRILFARNAPSASTATNTGAGAVVTSNRLNSWLDAQSKLPEVSDALGNYGAGSPATHSSAVDQGPGGNLPYWARRGSISFQKDVSDNHDNPNQVVGAAGGAGGGGGRQPPRSDSDSEYIPTSDDSIVDGSFTSSESHQRPHEVDDRIATQYFCHKATVNRNNLAYHDLRDNGQANNHHPIRVYTGNGGRLEYATGLITRNNLDQGTVTNEATRDHIHSELGGHDGDDAGHIFALRLGGPGHENWNVFPQNADVNRGEFSQREREVAEMFNNENVQAVRYTILPVYENNQATRPTHFFQRATAILQHGDGETLTRIVPNP